MLNKTGHLRQAVLRVAADLIGDLNTADPEYVRAVVEMSRELIGYTGEAELADADVMGVVALLLL